MADFADEVRRLMADRGLSLRGLARAAGYDPSHLSKILSGRKPPSPYLAARLDDVLGADGKVKEAATAHAARSPVSGQGARRRRGKAVPAAAAEAAARPTRGSGARATGSAGPHTPTWAAG